MDGHGQPVVTPRPAFRERRNRLETWSERDQRVSNGTNEIGRGYVVRQGRVQGQRLTSYVDLQCVTDRACGWLTLVLHFLGPSHLHHLSAWVPATSRILGYRGPSWRQALPRVAGSVRRS